MKTELAKLSGVDMEETLSCKIFWLKFGNVLVVTTLF